MLDPEFFRQAAPVAARVTQSTITILAGALLGAELDHRLDTTPWLFFAGLLLGIASGALVLFRGLLQKTPPSDDDHPPDLP